MVPFFGRAVLLRVLGHNNSGLEDSILSESPLDNGTFSFRKKIRRNSPVKYWNRFYSIRYLEPVSELFKIFL